MQKIRQTGREWYQSLRKPSWAPPPWLFGPVWTVLYIAIAVSYSHVLMLTTSGTVSWTVLLPFGLNLLFNLAFTPLQFGLRSNTLALADIILVLATLAWALVSITPYARWVALINLPYLAWVTFATVLQAAITWLNR